MDQRQSEDTARAYTVDRPTGCFRPSRIRRPIGHMQLADSDDEDAGDVDDNDDTHLVDLWNQSQSSSTDVEELA